MKGIGINQFKAAEGNSLIARIPLVGINHFEVETFGISLSEIDVDKINSVLAFIDQSKTKIISIANSLLTGIYNSREFTKYKRGDLSYIISGCYLEKDFLHTQKFKVVIDLKDINLVQKLDEYYGHRYLIYQLHGTGGILIGAEWSY
jgi:hypothetical protein